MFILLSWQNSMLVNYALQALVSLVVFGEEGSEDGGAELSHPCPE